MGIDTDKLEILILYIERWLAGGSTSRNINMLARLTAVTAPTIRRLLQRENCPELETVICLLNIVASPEESLRVLGENAALSSFMKRIASVPGEFKNDAEKDNADEIGVHLYNRERFWCFTIAMAVGVTPEFIEKLCGSYGLYELEKMVEEKILTERKPGRFYPTSSIGGAQVKNKTTYSDAVNHIAEAARKDDNAQKLFMVYNVNAETSAKIREKCLIAYTECVELAQSNPGDIVIATAVVNAKILGEGE